MYTTFLFPFLDFFSQIAYLFPMFSISILHKNDKMLEMLGESRFFCFSVKN